jgi:diacylglycerol kinase family enzyme
MIQPSPARCTRGPAFAAGFAAGTAATFLAVRLALPAIKAQYRGLRAHAAEVAQPALIINRWSGDGKADRYRLADRAAELGVRVTMLERGDDLRELARAAIDAGADAIGMAGGDGSLGLVAEVAVERDVPFFCIPVGTRNHFALDVGLNRDDPLAALAAVDGGEELRIDYGMAGDRVFLNNVSFGIYATAVHRDGYREDKVGTLTAVTQELADDPSTTPSLQFEAPDGQTIDGAAVLLISNNAYTWSGPPDFGRRKHLDRGELGALSILSVPAGTDVLTATVRDLAGRLEWQTAQLQLRSDDDEIPAGLDGEAVMLPQPVQLRSVAQGLRLLVPQGARPGYLAPSQAAVAHLLDIANLAEQD